MVFCARTQTGCWQLCICYIDIMEPYEMRQERLLAQYYFKCQCELCIMTKDVDMRNALRCPRENCIGFVRYPGNIFWTKILAVHDAVLYSLFFAISDNLETTEMYFCQCSSCLTELSMPLADIQERQDRIVNLLNLGSSMIKNGKWRLQDVLWRYINNTHYFIIHRQAAGTAKFGKLYPHRWGLPP